MRRKSVFGSLLFIYLFHGMALSQNLADTKITAKKDTVPAISVNNPCERLTPYHWNVIKINPTPMLIWVNVKNFTLSYERLIAKNHSLALQAGYLLLPRLLGDTVAGLIAITSNDRGGINLAFDYRYYPGSRNRRPAPDGLYLGAYISYYGYRFKNSFDIVGTTTKEEGSLKAQLEMLNLGIDLGYQFIFWKRFSLDLLLFGPSLTWYRTRIDFTGNLNPSDIEGIDQEVLNDLIASFPMLKYLFREHAVSYSSWDIMTAFSFRYSIQFGFHF